MARAGTPLERLQGVTGHRGPLREIYRLPDGRTLRLRTNRSRVLMTGAVGENRYHIDAPMNLEGQDFVGIAMPAQRPGWVDCYQIPTDVAISALHTAHATWVQAHPNTPEQSAVRVVSFDGDPQRPGEGFAVKWAQYLIASVPAEATEQPAAQPSLNGSEAIIEAKRIVAAAYRVPESAVTITVAF
jgi:hypothetical protein